MPKNVNSNKKMSVSSGINVFLYNFNVSSFCVKFSWRSTNASNCCTRTRFWTPVRFNSMFSIVVMYNNRDANSAQTVKTTRSALTVHRFCVVYIIVADIPDHLLLVLGHRRLDVTLYYYCAFHIMCIQLDRISYVYVLHYISI